MTSDERRQYDGHVTRPNHGEWALRINPWDPEVTHKLEQLPGIRVDEQNELARGRIDAVAAAAQRLGYAPKFDEWDGFPFVGPEHLRTYQLEGVAWLYKTLKTHGAAILADEMGLGKSLQAITVASALSAHNGNGRTFVVCPGSVRETWAEELQKWLPSQTVATLRPITTKRHQREWDNSPKASWVISSYDLADRAFETAFTSSLPITLVMDEAHLLKGRKAQRSRLLEQIANQVRFKLLMTGTPIWTRPRDFYQQLKIGFGTRFGNRHDFDFTYCGGVINDHGGMVNNGATRTDELKLRLSYYMLRREKKDVAKDLPSLTRQVIWTDPTPEALKAFQRMNTGGVFAAASSGQAFQQALLSTLEGKIPTAVELAKEARRFLLFTWLKVHAKKMASQLNAAEVPCVCITGEMTAEERQKAIRQAEAAGHGVVATIDSASTGINMQGVASTGIMHALDWSPPKLAQAEARLHRMGQTQPVTWYYVCMRDTLDAVVAKNIVGKLDQWRSIMGEESNVKLRDALDDNLNGVASEADALQALYSALTDEDDES